MSPCRCCSQAQAGAVLAATDVSAAVSSNCTLDVGVPTCNISTTTPGYALTAGQTLRVDWTCICGQGNAPAMDPVTGACTPCMAGAPCHLTMPAWTRSHSSA